MRAGASGGVSCVELTDWVSEPMRLVEALGGDRRWTFDEVGFIVTAETVEKQEMTNATAIDL